MPRPRKFRRVCCLPENNSFAPVHTKFNEENMIVMTVEEYESIRLIDYEGYTQEQCSQYMSIARTTVQQIYFSARKKLSQSLVDGKCLMISGGNYKLCDGKENMCHCSNCQKKKVIEDFNEEG